MIRQTPFVIALSLALISALSPSLPTFQAASRDEIQAPRWGGISGEGSIQSPRGGGHRDTTHQAPRA